MLLLVVDSVQDVSQDGLLAYALIFYALIYIYFPPGAMLSPINTAG